MSAILPNGAIFEIAANDGPPTDFTAISNGKPPEVTVEAHGFQDGDILVVTSGWTRLNGKVVRVAGAADDTFTLEGMDTTKTTVYTAGSGMGTVRAATGWTQISQVTDNNSSGGEQQFATFGFLEESDDRQLPTTKNPITLTLTVADDDSLPYVAPVEAADDDREPRVLRLTLPNGATIYYNAYVSITPTPTLTRNNVMARVITLSLASRPTRYKGA
jgi:hypothetical protein